MTKAEEEIAYPGLLAVERDPGFVKVKDPRPPGSRVVLSLEFLTMLDTGDNAIFIRHDTIRIGRPESISYKVVGWDDVSWSLVLERLP